MAHRQLPIAQPTRHDLDAVKINLHYQLRRQEYDPNFIPTIDASSILCENVTLDEFEVTSVLNKWASNLQSRNDEIKMVQSKLDKVENDLKELEKWRGAFTASKTTITEMCSSKMVGGLNIKFPEHADTLTHIIDDYEAELVTLQHNLESKRAETQVQLDNAQQCKVHAMETMTRLMKQMPEAKKMLNATEHTCSVCYEAQLNTVVIPCGHMFCNGCVEKSQQSCPMCRTHIERKVKMRYDASSAAPPTTEPEPAPWMGLLRNSADYADDVNQNSEVWG